MLKCDSCFSLQLTHGTQEVGRQTVHKLQIATFWDIYIYIYIYPISPHIYIYIK